MKDYLNQGGQATCPEQAKRVEGGIRKFLTWSVAIAYNFADC